MACAKDGPLAILRDDGTVFLAVNGTTPINPKHRELLPYAGQRVTATGREYLRAGLHLLTIETVTAAKEMRFAARCQKVIYVMECLEPISFQIENDA